MKKHLLVIIGFSLGVGALAVDAQAQTGGTSHGQRISYASQKGGIYRTQRPTYRKYTYTYTKYKRDRFGNKVKVGTRKHDVYRPSYNARTSVDTGATVFKKNHYYANSFHNY